MRGLHNGMFGGRQAGKAPGFELGYALVRIQPSDPCFTQGFYAGVVQRLECDLAKVEVASSSLAARSKFLPVEQVWSLHWSEKPANTVRSRGQAPEVSL